MEKKQKTPRIAPTAHVAPGAVVLGDVALGEQAPFGITPLKPAAPHARRSLAQDEITVKARCAGHDTRLCKLDLDNLLYHENLSLI